MPLFNCEVSLILTWSENCVFTSIEKRARTNTRGDTSPTNAIFKITDTKLYVSVVTLSTENDKTLLEQLRAVFKRTINGINIGQKLLTRRKITTLTNYLIDPTFTKFSRLFVLSFENEDDRTSF